MALFLLCGPCSFSEMPRMFLPPASRASVRYVKTGVQPSMDALQLSGSIPLASFFLPCLRGQACLPLDHLPPVSVAVSRPEKEVIQRKLCEDAHQAVHRVYLKSNGEAPELS